MATATKRNDGNPFGEDEQRELAEPFQEEKGRVLCPACEGGVVAGERWVNNRDEVFECPDCGTDVPAHGEAVFSAEEIAGARAAAGRSA